MSVLQVEYFDGKISLKHPATMVVAKGRMKIVGRDVDLDLDARRVRRSLRVADTPRWFYLPGGGACVTTDNNEVDRITRTRRYERLLHRWESHPAYAALAVLLVAATAWLLLDRGLPAAAEQIAAHIPVQAEAELGRQTLQGLEQNLMQPSKLPESTKVALRTKFNELVREGGEQTPYQLEFRASRFIGPNAFALPSGIIVVTDELVKIAKRDDEILGVLAHELGHVRHRHSMRMLLEGSATALVVAGITGDVSSAAALASAAPALLLSSKYSRDNEREADSFAIALMQKGKINPRHLVAILERMAKSQEGVPTVPTFLSSHPPTEERKAIALASAPIVEEPEPPAKPAQAEVRAPVRRLVLQDPAQQELADLLSKRDYRGLDRILGGLQSAFEKDPSGSSALANAYRTFGELPDSAGAALDDWVQNWPASYPARVARARYLLSRGLEARGNRNARDTSEENLNAMRAFLTRARADLEVSLRLDAKPYASHEALLMMVRYVGDADQKRQWYEAAVKVAPQDAYLRTLHMSNIEPRWGGSLKEMDGFASQASVELKNPRDAAMVLARPPAYRAQERAQADDWNGALRYYDESLKLHQDASVLCERSFALSTLKRHDEAFADVKSALATGRATPYCLDRAVSAGLNANDPNEVVALLDLVLKAEPGLVPALNQRAWALQETGKLDLAFRDLLASAKQGDGWAQMEVGTWYQEGKGVKRDYEQSLIWLAKAAEQNVPDADQRMQMVRKQAGK